MKNTLIPWTTNANPINYTTEVGQNWMLQGATGSKQSRLNYNGSADAVLVDSNVNFENGQVYWEKNAVIENLIIDGQGSTNANGIVLENVYNCLIRNVTIKNFERGIVLRDTGQDYSEYNTIKHVRLENCKIGILFESTTGTGSFAFTNLDDVGIQLKNDSNAVGIQVGSENYTTVATPYSAYIKATIWMDSSGGSGMKLINGGINGGLVNLHVRGTSGIRYGVDIADANNNNAITGSQSNLAGHPLFNGFLLSTYGIDTPVHNHSPAYNCDITSVQLP